MFVCQWHLDVPYGRQGDALRVMEAWGKEKLATSGFRKVKGTRVMVGHIGGSPSHIVDEYVFETLADFEAAIADMREERFRALSDRLAEFVVPGSQHWEVFRVVG